METTNCAHDTLINNISSHSGIRFGHLNINGLKNKIIDLTILLAETKFEIFAVTETHLTDNITDNEISIPN